MFSALLLVIALGSDPAAAASKSLAVPNVSQLPQTNWCWAASSQAVLSFTGNAPGMCVIADWARDRNGWGSDNCCANGTGSICNQPNAMWGAAGSMQSILAHWGAESESKGRSLSLAEVQEALDGDSPVVVRWGWTNGGGHFVVLHGYADATMTIMDPVDGPLVMSHSALRSTPLRTWTHSLIVKPKRVTYVVDDTGSMGDEINGVRSILLGQVDGFESAGKFVQYTLVTYKDDVSVRGRTTMHSEIRTWLNSLFADGGGDCPEEGYSALDTACEESPQSDIWWMTDADSHGGFLRMLQTQFRLWVGGCKLHSTILGSCGGFAVASVAGGDDGSGQLQSVPYDEARRPPAADPHAAAAIFNVDPFTAGETLSALTGGLFFPVTTTTLPSATNIILQEVLSTALLTRLTLAAGDHITMVPVDGSLPDLKIILDVSIGASGALSVIDPLGTVLSGGDPGVEEITSGQSRLLIVTPPALKPGVFKLQTQSNGAHVISVSGGSPHALSLIGDFTAGIGQSFPVRLFISTAQGPTALGGPGDAGPGGGPLQPVHLAELNRPYDPAQLHFFRSREDGSDLVPLDLFDDGEHGDAEPGDGVFGGATNFDSAGRYRFYVADEDDLFLRAASQIVAADAVSVTATDPVLVPPDATASHTFTVRNLSGAPRTFDLLVSSSTTWDDLSGVPASALLQPDEQLQVTVPVQVPPGATAGEISTVSMTAAASDDPTVNDTGQTATIAWTGPILSVSGPLSVRPGDELILQGNAFGSDPGPGYRSSDSNHITVGGVQVPDADVLEWSPTTIRVRVPAGSSSGVLFVVAQGAESNEVLVIVLPRQPAPIAVASAPAVNGTGLAIIAALLALIGRSRLYQRGG